jgi:uncharacterized protein YaaW (UPF0174 family)
MRPLRKFESFDNKMSTEEMIQQLCNQGWERQELEMMSDKELEEMCSEVPEEMSESRYFKYKNKKRLMR